MCPSAIVADDIEQATHGEKSANIPVLAIKQKPRLVTDTTDKVNNNFKSLFNAHGVVLGDIFQLKRAQIL